MLQKPKRVIADVKGSYKYPKIHGTVEFFPAQDGVLVRTDIFGLPTTAGQCGGKFFGFHIHSGGSCSGNEQDPFADALIHYNPHNCSHPYHAGDLPPLLGNSGHAFTIFLTNRFSMSEIIGKTIIIHSMADDFTTQPSGNSGEKIACGQIVLSN